MPLRARIVHLLTSHRLSLSDEKQLQEQIATVLSADGLYFRREHRLAPGDIVDFLILNQAEPPIEGVAIEIKIKGNRRDIFRQVERYCGHAAVHELVLATNVPMALPSPMCGKPVSVAHLGRGWV
jgi:hypothetical protein